MVNCMHQHIRIFLTVWCMRSRGARRPSKLAPPESSTMGGPLCGFFALLIWHVAGQTSPFTWTMPQGKSGACRTTGGGSGVFTVWLELSKEECEAQCAKDVSCKAYEYSRLIRSAPRCELHTVPVRTYSPSMSREHCRALYCTPSADHLRLTTHGVYTLPAGHPHYSRGWL